MKQFSIRTAVLFCLVLAVPVGAYLGYRQGLGDGIEEAMAAAEHAYISPSGGLSATLAGTPCATAGRFEYFHGEGALVCGQDKQWIHASCAHGDEGKLSHDDQGLVLRCDKDAWQWQQAAVQLERMRRISVPVEVVTIHATQVVAAR